MHLTSKGYGMVAAGLESLIYEKRGEERDAEEKESQGPPKKPRYDAAESRPAWVKEAWRRLLGEEGVEGSRGRPSNTPGEAEIRIEEVEEDPTPEKALAAMANSIATTDPGPDPDSRVTEAVTGGGTTAPPEAPTGAAAGPGEPLAVEPCSVANHFSL